jgi:hypothetical protein
MHVQLIVSALSFITEITSHVKNTTTTTIIIITTMYKKR